MEKTNFEKENKRKDIALFKYAIISPLISGLNSFPTKEAFFRDAASKKYTLPNGKQTTLTAGTIKKWYIDYNKGGFDSLIPNVRNDAGISRKIPVNLVDQIISIKKQFPHITGKAIYRKLIEDGNIDANKTSLSSIYRFLNNNNLNIHSDNKLERKPFEMEFSNDCWQRRHQSWTDY